ncbi:MAG: response regulator, partial [Chitinivibrionales bacterium]|nr:response regulator [Chitinivibrionales bacterium]
PILVVSQNVDEESAQVAFDLIKTGVSDFILRSNISRLVSSLKLQLKASKLSVSNRLSDAAIIDSEQSYRTIVELSPHMILLCNLEGIITMCNHQTCRLLGYDTIGDVIGKKISDFLLLSDAAVQPQDSDLIHSLVSTSSIKGGQPVALTMISSSGSRLPLEIRCNVVYSNRTTPKAVVCVGHDITERMKLEEQLRQSQKLEAIGQFAGGVAHDFNNFLTVLTGYASFLQEGLENNSELMVFVNHILNVAEKAAYTTKSLLTFSKKQSPEIITINLKRTILSLTKFLSRIIGEHIELKTELTQEDITIYAGAGHIEQILMNLVTNSRDAMPRGGTLLIRTEVVPQEFQHERHTLDPSLEYVKIIVQDSGVGMDDETQRRIFEPFFTTKQTGTDSGLGLSTVYGIVNQIRGFIDVQSAVEKGTKISIFIPIIKKQPERKTSLKKDLLLPRGSETILIVEDDEYVRGISADVLSDAGYRVIQAGDGSSALKLYERNKGKIDLMISDIIMPKKSGKEVYEEIIRMTPAGIRTIFMSGYTAETIRESGLIEDKVYFLSKPIFPAELLKKVREVLDSDKALNV